LSFIGSFEDSPPPRRARPKQTRNRDEKIPSSIWLIPMEILVKCEIEAKKTGDRKKVPKAFISFLYKETSYTLAMQSTRRGNNAKNWKNISTGKYRCPSLHLADNIYQSLGKKVWCEDHNGKPADTWKPVDERLPEPTMRCSICPTPFSKKWVEGGRQCLRKTCGSNSKCTQHFKLT